MSVRSVINKAIDKKYYKLVTYLIENMLNAENGH